MNGKPVAVAVVSEREFANEVLVSVRWEGVAVDRPLVQGVLVCSCRSWQATRKLADRLVRAINGQAAFTEPEVRFDRDGRSYVGCRSHVLGRTLNADLKKLGY